MVVVGEDDVARHAALLTEALREPEAFRSRCRGNGLDLLAADAPVRTRQHQPAADDARQKRHRAERSPVPLDAYSSLQCRKEAIDAQAFRGGAVGGGEAGDDFAVEAPGTEADAIAGNAEHQVLERNLPLERCAGAAEERDLVSAQDGTCQDVADAPGRQVYDLGEDGIGPERFLGRDVRLDTLADGRIGVAEAAEHSRARGSRGVVEEEAEVAPLDGLHRGSGERGHDVKGVGHRRRALRILERREVVLGERELLASGRERAREELQLRGIARAPRLAPLGGAVQRKAGQQRRCLGRAIARALEADARLLVERIEERHLPVESVTVRERVAELFESATTGLMGEAAQDLDAAKDLRHDGLA